MLLLNKRRGYGYELGLILDAESCEDAEARAVQAVFDGFKAREDGFRPSLPDAGDLVPCVVEFYDMRV